MPHPGVKNKPDAAGLRDLYVEQGLSMPAIAAQYGVTTTSVRRWLENAEIERRGGGGWPRAEVAAADPIAALLEARRLAWQSLTQDERRARITQAVDGFLMCVEERSMREWHAQR